MTAPSQPYGVARCEDLERLLDLHAKWLQANHQAGETESYIEAQSESSWPFRGQGPESSRRHLEEQTKKAEALRDEFLAARSALMSRLDAMSSITPTTQENTMDFIIPTAEEVRALADSLTSARAREELKQVVAAIKDAAQDGRLSVMTEPISLPVKAELEAKGYKVTYYDDQLSDKRGSVVSWAKG